MCCGFFQIVFYCIIYREIIIYKPEKVSDDSKNISVIICAKNEAENLFNFIPLIIKQEYSDFEILVINDNSTDNTNEVIEFLSGKYRIEMTDRNIELRMIRVTDKTYEGKKEALMKGISYAKYKYLMLTDADCYPYSTRWLCLMQQNFSENTDIVLGYGGYKQQKGLLNSMIRYEALYTAIQYFSFALRGIPYMGVGRNLAYTKSVFKKAKGFSKHLHIPSGDDDLFINQIAGKKNIAVETRHDSFTYSIAKETFKDWFIQKKRHLSTSVYYKIKHKILLGGETLSRIIFYFSFVVLIFLYFLANNETFLHHDFFIIIFGVIFFSRLIVYYYCIGRAIKHFNEKNLIRTGILFDLILPLLYILVVLSKVIFPNKFRWK